MWKNINLQDARTRLSSTVKSVAKEAMETARELRSVHQRQASEDETVCSTFVAPGTMLWGYHDPVMDTIL